MSDQKNRGGIPLTEEEKRESEAVWEEIEDMIERLDKAKELKGEERKRG